MGATTGIAWTRSTRNFWSGCTKIGPGCDGCYAEASSRRMRGVNEATGQAINWGVGAERVPHLAGADHDVRKWDKLCKLERNGGVHKKGHHITCFTEDWPRPGFWPVFINSYSDILDNEVPKLWRDTLFTTVEECPHLHFQLVTKRIGNLEDMLAGRWSEGRMPKNIWLIITVVDQAELDRDGAKLLALTEQLGFPVIGLSMEPQLGEIDARRFLEEAEQMEQLVWGINGGESNQPGHPARPFVIEWAYELAEQFDAANQSFFFKQAGSRPVHRDGTAVLGITGKGDNPLQWDERLRVQQFPV